MSVTALRTLGDPILSAPCENLWGEGTGSAPARTALIVDEMTAALRGTSGVAIAANQLGHSLRIVVIEDETVKDDERLGDKRLERVPHTVMIDPVIVEQSSVSVLHVEGCLSVPGYYALVERPEWVEVQWRGPDGESRHARFEGWPARIVSHELDHLDGLTVVNRTEAWGLMEITTYERLWRGVAPVRVRDALTGTQPRHTAGGAASDAV